jgi:hypothetical protein
MNSSPLRWTILTFCFTLFSFMAGGCAVTGGGYGYDGGGVGVGLDYYEPYGGGYGGWGSGYRVGPVRGGDNRRSEPSRGRGNQHAYRSAPASHSAPSIPSHARSGGGSRSH